MNMITTDATEDEGIISKYKMKKISSEPEFASPTENPDRNPPSTILKIILLRASITKIKNSRNEELSCLKPRALLKKPLVVPFTNTDK